MFNNNIINGNVNTNIKNGGECQGGTSGGFPGETHPHRDNMGVENSSNGITNQNWNIDYLTITAWGDHKKFIEYYISSGLEALLGSFVDKETKKRFYKNFHATPGSIHLYFDPIDENEDIRFTVSIPGLNLQSMGYEKIQDLVCFFFRSYDRIKFPRIDIAFNDVGFEVSELHQVLLNDIKIPDAKVVKSPYKRETLRFISSPGQKQEKLPGKEQKIGCDTVYIGSRDSERYMRCYNLHGYTRIEIEYKQKKAFQVVMDVLFPMDGVDPLNMAMGHLIDYLDILWKPFKDFINGFKALHKKLNKRIAEIKIEKIKEWIKYSVSRALAVVLMFEGDKEFLNLVHEVGKQKIKKDPGRYKELIFSY